MNDLAERKSKTHPASHLLVRDVPEAWILKGLSTRKTNKHQASHCLPLKCTPVPSIVARKAVLEFLLVRDENEGVTILPTCGEILAACRLDNLRTQERQQII